MTKSAAQLREEVKTRKRELEVALEEKEEEKKKAKTLANGIADEWLCPITQELPVDPVTAEDGKVYERSAIEQWLAQKQTSPSTGEAMGTRLFAATQVKNTIEALVKSGSIDGDKAKAWQQKLKDETIVKELRAKAEGGNGRAMWWLGVWYDLGKHGIAVDVAQARAWYERSAAARDPKGMAAFGGCLLRGSGGPINAALGLINITEAATLGSNLGACVLGRALFYGQYGLPRDHARARFWLEKVVDGTCPHKHLSNATVQRAADWLRELGDE